MKVLFIVLNEVERLDDVLDAFVEAGVTGATILDSQGMGSILTNGHKSMKFYGTLLNLLDNARPYNKTIFTVIEDDKVLDDAVNAVRKILDLDKPGVGLMFSIPVGKIY